MIIPPPPPVRYEQKIESPCREVIPEESLQDESSFDQTMTSSTNPVEPSAPRLSRQGSTIGSPSILELDAQHRRHYQHLGNHPQIQIQYNNNRHPQARNQSWAYFGHYDHQTRPCDSNGTRGGSSSNIYHIPNTQGLHTFQQQPYRYLSFDSGHLLSHIQPKQSTWCTPGTMMMMDTNEFGEDLFHTHALGPVAPFHLEGRVPKPERWPGEHSQHYHTPDDNDHDDGRASSISGSTSPTILSLAASPLHRHGGPLSTASSSKATSRSNSPIRQQQQQQQQQISRAPLQEMNLNNTTEQYLRQPVAGHPPSPGLTRLLRPMENSPTAMRSMKGGGVDDDDDDLLGSHRNDFRDENIPRSPVPATAAFMDLTMMMTTTLEDEQDRWKSPTLSALASQTSSLASSPRVKSPLSEEWRGQ
ncbi:hypothetical protein BG004_005274, partial [Podila humilis]